MCTQFSYIYIPLPFTMFAFLERIVEVMSEPGTVRANVKTMAIELVGQAVVDPSMPW